MTGYVTTKIDFAKIQSTVNAAREINEAGDTDQAKIILNKMADTIKEEVK